LFDARQQRAALGASTFLNYMHALPEEWQKLVRETLREDPQPKVAAPKAGTGSAGSSANVSTTAPAPLETFFESFFFADTEQRYTAWKALTDQVRIEATSNMLIREWASTIVPAIDYYAGQASSAAQPLAALEALAYNTGLSELGEVEAQEADSYVACRKISAKLLESATATQKLDLWVRLEGNPKAQNFLKAMAYGTLEGWKAGAQKESTYEDKPALATTESDSGEEAQTDPESDSDDAFAEFWEDATQQNARVVRDLSAGNQVDVIELAGQYRFTTRASDVEAAFPLGTWSKFTASITGLNDITLTLNGVSGFNLAGLRGYLSELNPAARSTITIVG
jgi:hypothetical protein